MGTRWNVSSPKVAYPNIVRLENAAYVQNRRGVPADVGGAAAAGASPADPGVLAGSSCGRGTSKTEGSGTRFLSQNRSSIAAAPGTASKRNPGP